MDVTTVRVYDAAQGTMLLRLPASSWSWTEELNSAGRLQVTVKGSREAARLELRRYLVPWRVNVAVVRGQDVLFAGALKHFNFDMATGVLKLDCGGGWSWFEKRLVLNHDLAAAWRDGEVRLDEHSPAAGWLLSLSGSLASIARDLVEEALKWGYLPFDLPAKEPGFNVRNYDGFDFATVSDRLKDLTGVINAPEIRFTPYLTGEGFLRFRMEAARELVDRVHEWDTRRPDSHVIVSSIDTDGDAISNQVYASGGKKDDLVLVARAMRSTEGWYPLLQSALSEHSSVSELDTLLGHCREAIVRGGAGQDSIAVKVSTDRRVRAGDWANLHVNDWFFGETVLPLKIVSVAGDEGEWLTCEARVRG
ncbi:hypothetical protein [Leucobacter sp. OH1287]|uniref:hypothetical protein n=1 Tax=Leucobacter sp. OH1287 TaxID=2491049 RepID=UPI000F5F90E1|nr:hypothetical protein [Leucobacter sp. OH1287]RRD61625.1 hypothetical protein EII30_02015 [Leucobacter sp. OH1287]